MPKKSNLPIEVHDHFQKANLLHGYAEKSFVEFADYAVEIGTELTAAKASVPHGRWEDECSRLFDGSLRRAQFYMAFSKNMAALPKASRAAIFFMESSLEGAAKAAKKAATPAPPPKTDPTPSAPSGGGKVYNDTFDPEDFKEPAKAKGKGKPPKQYDRSALLKRWEQSIGQLARTVDKIAELLGESQCESHKTVHDHMREANEEMTEWMSNGD